MGGYEVGEVDTGTSEWVDRIMNGILQGRKPVRMETCVNNELAEIEGLQKVMEEWFGEKVLGW